MRSLIEAHLDSRQVSRVIYGAIIGLALVVALEAHPPGPGIVAGTLLGTAVAVGLAELYSEMLGGEARTHRRVRGTALRELLHDLAAVSFGIGFPSVFFLLAVLDVVEEDTAFTIAKWSGLGLIAFYGFCAARLGGETLGASMMRALAAGLIAAFLIALKAVLH